MSGADTVVFTLNWNGASDTCRLLRSLLEVHVPYAIWVVDNGSDTDESELFRKANPQVLVFRLSENLGFAGGVNWAVKKASDLGFRYAYEINNDCIVREDPVKACVRIADGNGKIAMVGSRFLVKDENGNYTVWGHNAHPGDFKNELAYADSVNGCAMLIRCSAFLEMGGIDIRFFCYHEEFDLCLSLREHGHSVVVARDSCVLHAHHGSDQNSNAHYYDIRNFFILRTKHNGMTSLCILHVCNNYISACLDFFQNKNRWKAYAQGVIDGVSGRFGKRMKCGWMRNAIGFFLATIVTITTWPPSMVYLTIKKRLMPFFSR